MARSCDREDLAVFGTISALILGVLGFLGLFSWMIWHGNNIVADNRRFKRGIAIEAECTVEDRWSDDCSCARAACSSKIYTYRVTSPACPNVTLSSAKEHQACKRKNKKTYIDFGESETCYIDSCERANFVWNYRPNRHNGVSFMVGGSFGIWFILMYGLYLGIIYDNDENEYSYVVNPNERTVENCEEVAMATTQI